MPAAWKLLKQGLQPLALLGTDPDLILLPLLLGRLLRCHECPQLGVPLCLKHICHQAVVGIN